MTAPSRVLRCRCGCAGHLHDRDFGAGKPGCPVSELCRVWCHVMRMVYTAVPEDVFYPARNRLVAAFARWAHKQRRAVDPFVVEALVDHRWEAGDGRLGRWKPADLRESLCDWFPRKVTMPPGEWDMVLQTVHAFIDFLFAGDLTDAHCAGREHLHTAVHDLAGEFNAAMGDETRYGLAKFWTMRMLAARVDPADQRAAERYIADVRAGRVVVDQQVLDRVMANHMSGPGEPPPPLPVVALPD